MSLLNFKHNSNTLKGEKKTIKLLLGIGALVGVIALGQTLAASINLNGGGPVEFGQGVTQTTSCDSEILVTPYSSFVNGDPGAFMFSELMLSQVDTTDQSDSGEGCAGKSFLIKLYEEDGTPINVSYTISISDNGTFSSNDGDINASGENGTNSSVTLTFDPAEVLASEVYRITIESSSTQAAPTGYQVGDTGPGGGIIFYVSDSDFSCGPQLNDTCRYLEVAPNGWNTGSDPQAIWAISSLGSQNVVGITDDDGTYDATGIGLGYQNSIAIMEQGNDATVAASLALSYSSVSSNDWYLPTSVELNLLCQWDRGVSPSVTTVCVGGSSNSTIFGAELSGIIGDYYWSSSEASGEMAWVVGMMNSGNWGAGFKNAQAFFIRPIRAF